jgi:hypothetical protein
MIFGRMKSVYKRNSGEKVKHTWFQIGDFVFRQKVKKI